MIPAPPVRDPRKEAILHVLIVLAGGLAAGGVAWWVMP